MGTPESTAQVMVALLTNAKRHAPSKAGVVTTTLCGVAER
jgi:hypothetical protein